MLTSRRLEKLLVIVMPLTLFLVLGATSVFAEAIVINNPFKCGEGTDECTLFTLLKVVINNILLPIGGVLAVLAFIYSGFLYVTAQGNETKLKTAHQALLYSAIGTAVLLGSWVISELIARTIQELR